MTNRCNILPALAVLATTCALSADVKLPSVFSDHMVMQREMPIMVWGTADPGALMHVDLRSTQGTSTKWRQVINVPASADGSFLVKLPAIEETDRTWTLTVSEYDTGGQKKQSETIVNDILIGEVWLCGGQSNMEWAMDWIGTTPEQKKGMNHPNLRLIKAPHVVSTKPMKDINAAWEVCTPETIGNWSAVGYYFGLALQEHLDVPVGLISSNWGGTRIEPWIERGDLAAHPRFAERTKALQASIREYDSMSDATRARMNEEARRQFGEQSKAYWRRVLARDPGLDSSWMQPGFDDSSWKSMKLPGLWEQANDELASYDGTIWFRKNVEIPQAWAGKPLVLELGKIDDSDITWVNGQQVGSTTNQHQATRSYPINARLVRGTSVDIAVCVLDPQGSGGFNGPKMRLSRADGEGNAINLAGDWRWHRGHETNLSGPRLATGTEKPGMTPQSPGSLNDAMIEPFVPFAMRGAIWYQGESNAGQHDEYRDLLPLLIQSWREDFGDHLAFGVVQLAAFRQVSDDPVQGGWANLRDAQLHAVRTVPNTGMAVATDVGDANDIHPRNKKAIGDRLAGWALHDVYGAEDAVPSGPIHSGSEVDGDGMTLTFDHAHGGLANASGGEEIGGFAIAGTDGRFSWAQAQVTGPNSIRVWSNDVPEPHIVRYGWQDNPVRADLVNGAGLPASPFRTDGPGASAGQ